MYSAAKKLNLFSQSIKKNYKELNLDDLIILLGRLHPLIIHLPIGFIILGILIELNKKKH